MAHKIEIEISANGSKAISAASKVQSEMKKIKGLKIDGDPFGGIENGAKSASRDVDALGSAISKVKGIIAGAFAVSSIYSFGKAAMTAAANTELLHKGLSFVLNSDEEADRLVKNIQAIGEASAYDTTELLPLARAWVNIGDNVDSATSKMQKIVDLGSAYGLTGEQVKAVNLALTQMQMAGKIGQQDMMQLINAGIPGWQILSEKMGIPVEQLKDMSSKSLLTEDAMNQLWDGITEKTEGASTSMADTLMGKFSNAQEAITNSMSAMGDILSQAFNAPGILDAAGEMAEGVKQHITSIRDAAKDVGLHEAIVSELEQISPAAASAADAVMNAFSSIRDTIKENQTAMGILVEAIVAIVTTVAVIKGVETAFIAAKSAAIAFAAACNANPIILAISLVVAALVVLYTHWDQIKEVAGAVRDSVVNAISGMVDSVESKFSGMVDWLQGKWQGLKEFFSHPIDAVVNIIKRSSSEGEAVPSAKGGVFGTFAAGGVVGGRIPALANGGQLKHGTPAIVGEAGPEAVIPLRDSVLSEIGRAIANSYSKKNIGKSVADSYTGGRDGRNPAEEITAKIKSEADIKPVSEYVKILQEAQRKAQAVGEEVARYTKLQTEANEKVKEYADGGQKAMEYQQKMAQITEQIQKLEGSGKNDEKLAALQQKQAILQQTYEKEKADAIRNAQEIAEERKNIETATADALVAIQDNALEKVYSRKTALMEAEHQLDSANSATFLEEFTAMMAQKDAITGESYATTLANEQALSEMRQIWHEQMMTNAVEWGVYMDELFTAAEDKLVNGVAQGLAQCIVYGKNFSDIMANLAGNVLSTLLQGVLKKALTTLTTMIGLGNTKHQQELKNAATEAAAQRAKTGVLAMNATAAYIAANPYSALAASSIVTGQMLAARGATAVANLATGGLVSGPGTGTSDSIPAMLSNGEYVINAAAVRRLGTSYLNTINSPHFSDGGQVGNGSSGEVTNGNVTLNVSAMDASSFMDFLRNGGMDSIKQMLFDGNRDFTTESGVW